MEGKAPRLRHGNPDCRKSSGERESAAALSRGQSRPAAREDFCAWSTGRFQESHDAARGLKNQRFFSLRQRRNCRRLKSITCGAAYGGESASPCAGLSNGVLTGRSAPAAGRGIQTAEKAPQKRESAAALSRGQSRPAARGDFCAWGTGMFQESHDAAGQAEKPKIFQRATKTKLPAAQIDNLRRGIWRGERFPIRQLVKWCFDGPKRPGRSTGIQTAEKAPGNARAPQPFRGVNRARRRGRIFARVSTGRSAPSAAADRALKGYTSEFLPNYMGRGQPLRLPTNMPLTKYF